MSSPTTSRLSPQQIEADIDTYLALKGVSNYTPHNARFALATAGETLDRLRAADEATIQAQNNLAAARDALLTAQQNFHEIILGVKNEVRVLFGPDSDQLAALGLKKKSDRSRPKRTAKSTTKA